MSPPLVILPLLVSLFNATFVVNGNMGPVSAQPDSVLCVIQEDMLLMAVHLHSFPLNRPPIFTGLLPTWDRNSLRGILIELGV
jgi:hypothetical protein